MSARRDFPLLIFLLLVGWMFSGWPVSRETAIPYYEETVVELQKPLPKLSAWFASFIMGPYGVFVRENLWMFAGGYALIALVLLIQPRYRNGGLGHVYLIVAGGAIVTVWFLGALWLSVVCREIHDDYTADGIGLFHPLYDRVGFWPRIASFITGVGFPLLMIAAGVGAFVGLPIYLLCTAFFLPGAAWGVCRLTVTLPFLAWHYMHYLFVPHPMEKVIKKHERVRLKRGVKIDHGAFAEELDMAKYDPEREGIPAWWKSKNWERRLKDILAARGRMKTEKDVADEYTEAARKSNRQQR